MNIQVKEVTDAEIAFGGNMKELLPEMADIPKEYPNRSKWEKFISEWFYNGGKSISLKAKEEIDTQKAVRHISAVLGSFEPKHEHKMAGCAYLASCFFKDVTFNK